MARVAANGIEIEYDVHGPADGEPLLLVMGLGQQLTRWPMEIVARLVGEGFRVVRFDNRDIGLSTWLDEAGAPDMPAVFTAIAGGRKPDVPYCSKIWPTTPRVCSTLWASSAPTWPGSRWAA